MAWNQTRITLYPDRWQATIRKTQRGKGEAKKECYVRYPERTKESKEQPIVPAELQGWLQEHGFAVQRSASTFAELVWNDVQVFVAIEADEVAEIEVTFTLSRDAWERHTVWNNLIVDLCHTWGLRLHDPRTGGVVQPSTFLGILQADPNWLEFRNQFGWPETLNEDDSARKG